MDIDAIKSIVPRGVTAHDKSDHRAKRLYLQFPNGYGFSAICGPYTYGGDEGLLEIAVVVDGEYNRGGWLNFRTRDFADKIEHITGREYPDDDVFGWCALDHARLIAAAVAAAPPVND